MAGRVTVFVRGGMIWFRFPRLLFQGRRSRCFTTGLFDSSRNREKAKGFALKAQDDIADGHFDYSLQRYRPCLHIVPGVEFADAAITIQKLWEQYFDFKSKMWAASTTRGNGRFTKHIDGCPYRNLSQAKQIRDYFFGTLTLDGCKRIFKELAACCDWAIGEELIDDFNPFRRFVRQLKAPRKPDINPFSKKEKELIIDAFEQHPDHNRYLPFVLFLFKTGCRPSEAIGLRWGAVNPEMTTVFFYEAVVEGIRKDSTKTYKSRTFPVNDSLRELLMSIKPSSAKPDLPVFRLPGGELINLGNFLERAWRPLLDALDIAYRVPYNARHTFVTACLKAGVPVTTVAQWVGNTPQTIWANYAGFIDGFDVPEL